jgi:hypothetical protein
MHRDVEMERNVIGPAPVSIPADETCHCLPVSIKNSYLSSCIAGRKNTYVRIAKPSPSSDPSRTVFITAIIYKPDSIARHSC